MMFLYKVKNGPKRLYNRPKRAKNLCTEAKNRAFGPKIPAEFALAELGGTPLLPSTENHPAQKPLA